MMRFQNQLDTPYHGNHLLRDQLLTTVELPSVQHELSKRIPRRSEQAINPVLHKLSSEKKTAGSTIANVAEERQVEFKETATSDNGEQAMYTLGQKYSGSAGTNTRPSWAKGKRIGDRYKHRRFSPAWMLVVKECIICDRKHRESDKDPISEVTVEVKRLKDKHP